MAQSKMHQAESRIDVTLDSDGVILCVLHGNITEELVRKSMGETAEFARQVKAQHKTPLLLIDAKAVTSQTSGARTEAKRLGGMGLFKIAVCGPSPALSLVVQYLIRSGGMAKYAQVFRDRSKAKRWLLTNEVAKVSTGRTGRITALVFVIILATAGFMGWVLGNDILKALIPGLKPINPISALTLAGFAVGALFLRQYGAGKVWAKIMPIAAALWGLIFSLHVLLRESFSTNVPIDSWLFTKAVLANENGLTSIRSAYMYIAISIMMLAVLTGQRRTWQRVLFAAASTVAFISGAGAIINYGFGFGVIVWAPSSLIAALSVLFLTYALQSVARQTRVFFPIWRAFHRYAPAIFVGVAMSVVTGVAWQQSRFDLDRNVESNIQRGFQDREVAINDKLDAYANALRGFRSFFESSDSVSPDEFRTYFRTSELTQNYPGFTAITFVRSVPASQRDAFNKELKSYTSADFPRYAQAAVYPVTDRSVMYPTTLLEPGSGMSNYGFDLNSNDTRRQVLETARDTGDLAASDIIDLNAARNDPSLGKRPGFYLSLPVYNHGKTHPTTIDGRREQIYGFVNALFESSILFGSTFSKDDDKTTKFVISNARTNDVLYTHNADAQNIEPGLKATKQFVVGTQVWRLDMYTTRYFGVSELSQNVPPLILTMGGVLTAMATFFMLSQLRRREHALNLAESMTEDLNNERNVAVATQQKDEAILSSIGDAVFAIDTKERITLFNPAAEIISGFTKEEAMGKPYKSVLKFVFEKDGKINDAFVVQALQGKLSSMKNHTQLIRKDGNKLAVADSAAPIRDARDTILGAIVVFRDVTKEYELDRAKSEFVSLASHQLRTPLSAIGWYSEMLLNGDVGKLSKSQKEHVTEIYEGNQRMVELVNSLLNVSRLELGKLQNDAAPTSLVEIIRSLRQEVEPTVKMKAMDVKMDVDEKLPMVTADPKLLRMIIQNLLSNAVKYTTEKGSVSAKLSLATAAGDDLKHITLKQPLKDYVFFKVTDTGYGIPAAQQPKIFQKMFRADNVRALDVEGTGLGLYIVREVVQKLGGKIWFTSTEGKGSTFYVVLPITTKSTVPKP